MFPVCLSAPSAPSISSVPQCLQYTLCILVSQVHHVHSALQCASVPCMPQFFQCTLCTPVSPVDHVCSSVYSTPYMPQCFQCALCPLWFPVLSVHLSKALHALCLQVHHVHPCVFRCTAEHPVSPTDLCALMSIIVLVLLYCDCTSLRSPGLSGPHDVCPTLAREHHTFWQHSVTLWLCSQFTRMYRSGMSSLISYITNVITPFIMT